MFFDFCDTFFAATHNTGIYYGVRYCLSLGGANMDDTRVELVLPNGVILDFFLAFGLVMMMNLHNMYLNIDLLRDIVSLWEGRI
jgi:hypothetical protein